MRNGHAAPIGTVALAVTLAIGALLVAPDAHAERVGRQPVATSVRH
jgi:hypothetical protein